VNRVQTPRAKTEISRFRRCSSAGQKASTVPQEARHQMSADHSLAGSNSCIAACGQSRWIGTETYWVENILIRQSGTALGKRRSK